MDRIEATTAQPYEHLERATRALRAQLRHRLAERGGAPDRSTLEVIGPAATVDGLGRAWFEYRGSVSGR